jgi:hypothetical protein
VKFLTTRLYLKMSFVKKAKTIAALVFHQITTLGVFIIWLRYERSQVSCLLKLVTNIKSAGKIIFTSKICNKECTWHFKLQHIHHEMTLTPLPFICLRFCVRCSTSCFKNFFIHIQNTSNYFWIVLQVLLSLTLQN